MKMLFVHIPKCAGIAMREIFPLPPHMDDTATHLPLREWRKMPNFAEYRTITVVRHPCDRFVSAWCYLAQQTPSHRFWDADEHERSQAMQFDDVNEAAMNAHGATALPHFRPMKYYGAQDCDVILRYEDLAYTMPNLPKRNVSKRGNWRDELSREAARMIEDAYSEDYRLFGYNKEDDNGE